MAQYDYQHPDGRIMTLFQSMQEKHQYIDHEGVEWKRIFESPGAIIDSIFNIDPKSSQEFVRKTGKRTGKLNDLFQLSAELSEKRAQKEGKDVLKEKSWDKYENSRSKGTVHPGRKKQQLKEVFGKNKHFEIED